MGQNKRGHKWFTKYHDELNDKEKEANSIFDKCLLTFSAGVFTLSFTFIRDVVCDNKKVTSKLLLYISWIVFAVTIVIMLIRLFINSFLSRKINIENNKNALLRIKINKDSYDEPKDKVIELSETINIILLLFFTGGITCLLIFTIQNMSK